MAQSIGDVKRIEPPHSEMMSELRIRIVGTEMMIVVSWKNELTAVPMPVRYMWCAQTIIERKPSTSSP